MYARIECIKMIFMILYKGYIENGDCIKEN